VKNKNDETEWDRQPAPGAAPSPRRMRLETSRLKQLLGLASIVYHDVCHPIAITDVSLESTVAWAGTDGRQVVVNNFNFSPAYRCSLHPKMTGHIVVARAWGIER
jgi:hypothetical protein